jgi:hypothetical protein
MSGTFRVAAFMRDASWMAGKTTDPRYAAGSGRFLERAVAGHAFVRLREKV